MTLAWDANTQPEVAGYKLYYGTAPGQYGNPVDCGNVTTCTVPNLAPGTYYFSVTAYDASGGQSGFSNEVSTAIPSGTDTQPPVISGVTSTGVSYAGATINWLTDEPADSQVQYGTSTSYGATSVFDGTLLSAHSVSLSGLSPGTTYHYRTNSRDAAGNLAHSADYTFTTPVPPDITPPTISGVASFAVTVSAATVSWSTNEASDSQVEYGTSISYGSSTALNSSMVTWHSQGLSGLASSTTYHYRVKSRDAAGNLAVSGDFTLTPPAPPDATPPAISGVDSSTVTETGTTIAWTTNEASDSQVEYGTSTAYGTSTLLDPTMVTVHSEALSGLTPSATYHYRVRSRDAAGNLAVSADYTFATISGVDLATGLVAAYAFDEGTGATTADASGDATAATLYNTRWTTRARFGYALFFNGNDSFVSAPAAGLPGIGEPKTISCWLYLSSKISMPQTVIALANASETAAIEHGIKDSQIGDMQYDKTWLVSAYPPSRRVWHHYAYTFDGSQNRLYIDGILVSSSTISPQAAPATIFEIGRWISGVEYFRGIIDELRIYSRPLDQDEIMAVMNTPIGNATIPAAAVVQPALRKAEVILKGCDAGTIRTSQPASHPVVGIRMSKPNYAPGDDVSAASYWISNPSPDGTSVELKSWLAAPGLDPIPVPLKGADELSALAAGLDQDLGPVELFRVSSDLPAGTYEFNARFIDPATGRLLSETTSSFSIETAARTAASRPGHNRTETPPWLTMETVMTSPDYDGLVPKAQCRIANTGAVPEVIELKVWLESQEDDLLIPVLSLGANGSLTLPAGSDFSLDPLTSFLSANRVSPGTYLLRYRILDPITGESLSEGLNNVVVR